MIRKHVARMLSIAAMTVLARGGAALPELPALPPARPLGYGVHLSKRERKGKSPAELQALRAERAHG
jgi:hypothetical protein